MTNLILGIDIGGTNIKSGVFELKSNKIIEKKYYKTPKKLKNFLNLLKKIIAYYKSIYPINKVGIGFPGNIDKSGEVIFCPHIPESIGYNLVSYLKKLKISLKIENDANLSAYAHLKFLEKNKSDLICLTIGTGIGGGVVIEKKILNSSRNIGVELGHIQVVDNGAQCSCGKKGCVEAYSSSSGMLKRYGDNKLKEFIDLYHLHKNGDNKATTIIQEGFYYLGIATGNFVNIFAPEVVYISGGISEKFNEFKNFFIDGVRKSILKFLYDKVEFKKSPLKDAGILGAVSLWI